MQKVEKASINSPAYRAMALKNKIPTINHANKSRLNRLYPSRLSSLYDLNHSRLRNLASYRLTTNFLDTGAPLTDLRYTHNICPHDFICLPDLLGKCSDKSCIYQHQSNYLMSDIDKLADILSYNPQLTGFEPDPELGEEENINLCRVKLKQYAAKLIAKGCGNAVEIIAKNLVKYVRFNKTDKELLCMTRRLPKVSNIVHDNDNDTQMET